MHSDTQNPFQIIISGFHRSGTSLTAQYLHRAGLNLGDRLMGANPSNPDGHFEDCDIVALHKDMLAANQRDWFTPGPDLSSRVPEFRERARNLLAQFPADQHMGFKDPRSSLFLPWWHELLDRPAAVIVFRHYAACYHSLRNRQAQNLTFAPSRHKDALFFWQQPQQALELWLAYNHAIIDYVKSNRDTTLLVSHHALLQGFNLPAVLNGQLGMNLEAACESGIRFSDKGIPGIREAIDARLQQRLDATLRTLNELCCSGHEPEANNHTDDEAAALTQIAPVEQQIEKIAQQCNQLQIAHPDSASGSRGQAPVSALATDKKAIKADIGYADHSDDVKQLVYWGKQHQSRQDHDAAEACWLKARHLVPCNHSILLQLALLARNQGQHRKSAVLMLAAIRLKPDDAGYHVHLAHALKQSDRTHQALDVVQHGLTLQADHIDLHLLQVALLSATGDTAAAYDACSAALSLFPDHGKLVKAMVQLAGETHDSTTAMSWFRRSVLLRIRQQKDYRQTLLQAIEQVPSDYRSALSQRVITELACLDS